jgi:hypothetical protein
MIWDIYIIIIINIEHLYFIFKSNIIHTHTSILLTSYTTTQVYV